MGLFAKDKVTGQIAAAALQPNPTPPPLAHLAQQQPDGALFAPQPAGVVMQQQQDVMRGFGATVYPDQGSLIAKPGFLGAPLQLFSNSGAAAPASATAV
jgi:hypothetical protein